MQISLHHPGVAGRQPRTSYVASYPRLHGWRGLLRHTPPAHQDTLIPILRRSSWASSATFRHSISLPCLDGVNQPRHSSAIGAFIRGRSLSRAISSGFAVCHPAKTRCKFSATSAALIQFRSNVSLSFPDSTPSPTRLPWSHADMPSIVRAL